MWKTRSLNNLMINALWDVTTFILVFCSHCFRASYCLHLQCRILVCDTAQSKARYKSLRGSYCLELRRLSPTNSIIFAYLYHFSQRPILTLFFHLSLFAIRSFFIAQNFVRMHGKLPVGQIYRSTVSS